MSGNVTSRSFEINILDEMQKRKWFLHLSLFVYFLLFLLFLKLENPLLVLALTLTLVIFLWMIFSVKNTIILMLCYISFLPVYNWGSRYPFFRGLYFNYSFLIGFILLTLAWILCERKFNHARPRWKPSGSDWMMGLFLVMVVFSMLRGLVEYQESNVILVEATLLMLYVFYFIFTRHFEIDSMQSIVKIVFIICVAVSIEFILLALSELDSSSILVKRIVTQQPHLAQVGLPMSVGYVLFSDRMHKKLLSILCGLLMAGMAFFSQQRGLWIGLFFSILLMGGFAFFRDRVTVVKILKYGLIICLGVALLIGSLFILDRLLFGSVLTTVLERFGTLTTLSTDASLKIRFAEITRALSQWDDSVVTVFFGSGMGASYEAIDIERSFSYSVDNSYMWIMWKMGIIGLAFFLGIIVNFYYKGIRIFNGTKVMKHRRVAAVLMSGMGGLLLIGMTNACLSNYRFIIIWALMLSAIEMLHRQFRTVRPLLGK